ncbi:MAG TPA: VWA-like domain-containing protein [Acidimicrobiia bacterium]
MTARLDDRKLAAARLFAATRFPYLASALFACTIRAERDCDTIAVDRAFRVYADPLWVERLAPEELGRLLAHHIGHLLRTHAERADALGVADAGTGGWWNRCSDAEINDDLALDGAVPEVAPDLPAHVGGHDQELAEHYYEHPSTGPRRWDCGSGADGIPRGWDDGGGSGGSGDGDGLGASQIDLLRLGTAAEIQQCAGTEPGTVPGGWLRWAESVLPSRIDWRRVLAAEIRTGVASAAGKVDYTYRRPSRRAGVAPRVVLPSLHRPVPEVAIVCDTSGSMHETLLARALAEVEGILVRAGLRQTRVRVLAVDTNVHAVRRVTSAKQVQLAGGGGTDMGAGIAAAASLRPRPSVVIVLTDGFTPWPERPPKGIRVVVGLLVEPDAPMAHLYPAPGWARTVRID